MSLTDAGDEFVQKSRELRTAWLAAHFDALDPADQATLRGRGGRSAAGCRRRHDIRRPPTRTRAERRAARTVSTFAALKIRNYRLYFSGQVVSNTGTWMQRIAQDWLVLSITNSPIAVGVTTALQFLPMLLFGLWGGVIADRYPKRTLLIGTQTGDGCAGRRSWRCSPSPGTSRSGTSTRSPSGSAW